MNTFIDQPVFPYHLLCMIPSFSFTPHNLPFFGFDLSTVSAKPMRSFYSLYKLPTSHLYIFCWVLQTLLNADSVKLQSFFLTALYMLSDFLWKECGSFAPREHQTPVMFLCLWTSCDEAVLPVTAVRRGVKYVVPDVPVAPAVQCFLLLPFVGPE